MRDRLAPVLALLALFLGGCVAGRSLDPTADWPDVPAAEAGRLLADLAAREQAVEGARGLVQVTVAAFGERRRFTQALVLQRPDRFRIEVLAFGATPVLLAASDGQTLQIHAVARREFLEGPSVAAALRELTGFALDPAVLVRLLLGLPPAPPPASAVVRVAPDGAQQAVHWEGRGGRVRLMLGGDPPRPMAGSLETPDLGEVTFGFADYGEVLGVSWPGRILLRRPADGIEVEVRYQTVEVNPPTGARAFRLDPPADPETVRRQMNGAWR